MSGQDLEKLERIWIFSLLFLISVASLGFAGHALA